MQWIYVSAWRGIKVHYRVSKWQQGSQQWQVYTKGFELRWTSQSRRSMSISRNRTVVNVNRMKSRLLERRILRTLDIKTSNAFCNNLMNRAIFITKIRTGFRPTKGHSVPLPRGGITPNAVRHLDSHMFVFCESHGFHSKEITALDGARGVGEVSRKT